MTGAPEVWHGFRDSPTETAKKLAWGYHDKSKGRHPHPIELFATGYHACGCHARGHRRRLFLRRKRRTRLIQLVSVTIGLAILISSVWFAANPFRRGTRRYRLFRREIAHFLNLAQLLNKQIVAEAEPEFVARIKAKMHRSVDRMVAEADKTS